MPLLRIKSLWYSNCQQLWASQLTRVSISGLPIIEFCITAYLKLFMCFFNIFIIKFLLITFLTLLMQYKTNLVITKYYISIKRYPARFASSCFCQDGGPISYLDRLHKCIVINIDLTSPYTPPSPSLKEQRYCVYMQIVLVWLVKFCGLN